MLIGQSLENQRQRLFFLCYVIAQILDFNQYLLKHLLQRLSSIDHGVVGIVVRTDWLLVSELWKGNKNRPCLVTVKDLKFWSNFKYLKGAAHDSWVDAREGLSIPVNQNEQFMELNKIEAGPQNLYLDLRVVLNLFR